MLKEQAGEKSKTSVRHSLMWLYKLADKHKLKLLAFVLGFFIIFLRRPDVLLNAQFWAEDGSVWYQSAYNHHFSMQTFFTPYAGYLGFFPRLVAVLSGLVGVEHAPLFFNGLALLVMSLPLLYLWSDRFDEFIPSKLFKLYLSLTYLTLPYTAEIYGNITNSQWFLALLSFMILFMKDSPRMYQKILDRAILAIACLSGPFSIFLCILVFVNYVFFKKRLVEKTKLLIVILGSLAQGICIILLPTAARNPTPVGPSSTQLINIIGGQLLGAGLAGYKAYTFLLTKPWITPVIAIIGIEIMLYVFWHGPRLLKLFVLYAGFVLGAALASPNGPLPGHTWWQTLATLQAGGRYYFLFHLAIVLCVGWLIFAAKPRILVMLGTVLFIVFITWGVRLDFRHNSVPDRHYKSFVNNLAHANSGETVTTIINPGPPWQLTVVKHK